MTNEAGHDVLVATNKWLREQLANSVAMDLSPRGRTEGGRRASARFAAQVRNGELPTPDMLGFCGGGCGADPALLAGRDYEVALDAKGSETA